MNASPSPSARAPGPRGSRAAGPRRGLRPTTAATTSAFSTRAACRSRRRGGHPARSSARALPRISRWRVGEPREIGFAQPPARLGVAAQRADARARRIDEHDVGLAAQRVERRRPAPAVEVDRLRVRHPRAAGAPAQLLELACASMSVATIRPRLPSRAAIASVLPPAPAHRSTTSRASAPPAATARSASSWLPSSCASIAPRLNASSANRLVRVSTMQRGIAPRAGPGRDPRARELAGERVAIADEQVGAHRHRRALVEREREGLRLVAPVGDEPLREPVRQRRGERDPRRRACARARSRRRSPATARPVELGLDARRRAPARAAARARAARAGARDRAARAWSCAPRASAESTRRRWRTRPYSVSPTNRRSCEPIHVSLRNVVREPVGHEAPVHARALPQLEHERAQPAAGDDVRRQLLVRDAIEIRQRSPIYPQRSAARVRGAKCDRRSR